MKKRKPTIVDIANYMGISPSAVSKAMSNHPRMSEKTKKEVAKVAEQLGYQRNNMATGLRKGKSGLIGVIVPYIHVNFFSTAIKGIEDVLGQAGYSIVIGQSKDETNKEVAQVDVFLNAQVEGIIASIASNTKDSSHFIKALASGVKVVLFDRTIPELDVDQIMIDDFDAATKATKHLFDQGYGKIGLISGPLELLPYKRRLDGYKAVLAQTGREFDENLIVETDISLESGKKAAAQLMDCKNPPDALFCLSDVLALGAMNAVRERGKKMPEEVGIMGFSNENFTTYVSPSLSTVDQFSEQMGNHAAKAILNQLRAEESHNHVPSKQVLSPKLLIRESSKIRK